MNNNEKANENIDYIDWSFIISCDIFYHLNVNFLFLMIHAKPMGLRLIFLVLLLGTVFSGRIISGDLSVDYGNAGTMTKLSFSFML